MCIIGIDIGGTKCGVAHANKDGQIYDTVEIPTSDPDDTLKRIFNIIDRIKPCRNSVFGIACGGPLDEKAGLIQSPPNLPGWDNVPIVNMIKNRYGKQAYLMNDANAGALAEWKFGAGRGFNNIVFLTYGTGMGAGLILNGKLYTGGSGAAGEIGHIRLESDGPVGFGKAGSFEGFCSGSGIGSCQVK